MSSSSSSSFCCCCCHTRRGENLGGCAILNTRRYDFSSRERDAKENRWDDLYSYFNLIVSSTWRTILTFVFSIHLEWRRIVGVICMKNPFIYIEWTITTIWISTMGNSWTNWVKSAWKSSFRFCPSSISSLFSSADSSCLIKTNSLSIYGHFCFSSVSFWPSFSSFSYVYIRNGKRCGSALAYFWSSSCWFHWSLPIKPHNTISSSPPSRSSWSIPCLLSLWFNRWFSPARFLSYTLPFSSIKVLRSIG